MIKPRIPEDSPSPWPITRVGVKAWILAAVFGFTINRCFHFFTTNEVPDWLVIAVSGMSIATGAACFYYVWKWIVALDDMQREMQLLSLAAAFPGFVLILVGADLLRAGGVIKPIDWHVGEAGMAMLAVYGVTWTILWLRKR